MSQTSINAAGQPVAFQGQLFDNAEVVDVISMFNQGTSEIPFGAGVVYGSDASGQGGQLPSTSADKPVGVNVFGYDHQKDANTDGSGNPEGDLGSTGLKKNASMQVLRKGRIWVPVATTITINPGDRAFLLFRTDGGQNTQPGIWSNAQDGGTDYIDCTRLAQFMTGVQTAADGTRIALLEVDFTNRNS